MMLIFHPVLVAAAVIPAVILLIRINKLDRLEHESHGLLVTLVFMGILSTALAVGLEEFGLYLTRDLAKTRPFFYSFLNNFIIIGLSEEGCKYALLKFKTWKSPEFNCQFDGVVYAVFVSLGFALWENIRYVLVYGFSTAVIRALTAVPGHACFGVFMGEWYGAAKRSENYGYPQQSKKYRRRALIIPAIAHGLYDFIASTEYFGGTWSFIIFIGILFLFTMRLTKNLSSKDEFINSSDAWWM